MKDLILPSINLGLLVAFLAYKLKGPIKEFIRTRAETIRQSDPVGAPSRRRTEAKAGVHVGLPAGSSSVVAT